VKSLTLPLLQQNYLDLQQNYPDLQQSSAEKPAASLVDSVENQCCKA